MAPATMPSMNPPDVIIRAKRFVEPRERACMAHAVRIRAFKLLTGLALSAVGTVTAIAAEGPGSASLLRASYAAQRADSSTAAFGGKPLHLQSTQTSSALRGDIHALIDHPFEKVQAALGDPGHWCDILILHPNVKGCQLEGAAATGTPALTISLGSAELPVKFSYQATAKAADYLDVRLGAPTGPLGTSDYRIRLEAAPMDDKRTILHLAYSHGYGVQARFAMQAYFNTLGRGKVGFTVIERNADGKPVYVGDLRGGLERNAMRYYASIESYLDALSAPPQQQPERRLSRWYAYTERFPLQLAEEKDYLDRKRREMQAM